MKKGMIYTLGLFLLIGSIGLISFASAACDQSQTIMTLSSSGGQGSGGAHGALWNQSYGTSICYNSIFKSYGGAENPHDGCAPDDIILYLSANNNSHAAGPSDSPVSPYTIPVCYKGLKECKLGSCTAEEAESGKCAVIAYITGTSNAHLSSPNSIYTGDSIYKPITCICTETDCERRIIPVRTGCSDYDENECADDPDSVASGDGCDAPTGSTCGCAWNSTTEICNTKWSLPPVSINGTDCTYTCSVEGSTVSECSGSSQILSAIATIIADPSSPPTACPIGSAPAALNCKSHSITKTCGTDFESASLPFFGAWQIAGSLMAIALIYALIERKRLF